ncbi:MAG: YigZ family protein [Corynebacterium sp.]|nr:YigZ family protein [Corynebacterium sp.]
MNQDYQRPAPDIIETELEIKRSRFITYLTRVENEEEAREFINDIKKQYPDARHHCSAYIYHVDDANAVERSSDDGEPSGTAGMPMLDMLKGSGLLDICAVVVRYFGGIKLGTGGLVRAYGDAVSQALEQVTPVLRAQRELYTIALDHSDAGRIEAELRNRGFVITDTHYGSQVTLTLAVIPGTDLAATVAALTAGTVEPEPAGRQWVEEKS